MKVRQVGEKLVVKREPGKQKLGQVCTNCGAPVALLLRTDFSGSWCGPLVLDPLQS